MSEAAQTFAVGGTLEFEGVAYSLKPLNYEGIARLSVWLEQRAYDGVRRAARYLTEEESREQMAQVARDVASGVYSPGSDAFSRSMISIDGMKQMLLICLDPTMTAETLDRFFTTRLQEIQELLKGVNGDPKAKTGRRRAKRSRSKT